MKLTKEVVEKISSIKGEPKWMLDFRLRSLDAFLKSNNPNFGPKLDIDYDNITYYKERENNLTDNWNNISCDVRNIFDDFTTKKEYDIIEFLKNYINKITKQFSGSRININFSSSANMAFITSFAPIDISIIVDNMVSNAKKAQANLLEIIIEVSKGILQMHFISNQPFNKDIGNINDIFERGFSTTKSTGMGLYHIKNIVDENKWKIIANRKEKEAEFIIIIENENRL